MAHWRDGFDTGSDMTRLEYFHALQRELNPGVFETQWLGFHTFQVQMAVLGTAEEAIEQCLVSIGEILATRGRGDADLERIVSQAPEPLSLKAAFLDVSQGAQGSPSKGDTEALARFSVYCFAHIAYGTEADALVNHDPPQVSS